MFKYTMTLAGLLFVGAVSAQAQTVCGKDSAACDIEFIATPIFETCIPCGEFAEGTFKIKNNVPASITITNTIVRDDESATTMEIIDGQVCKNVPHNGVCEAVIKVTAPSCDSGEVETTIEATFVATPNTNNAPIKSNFEVTVNCETAEFLTVSSGQDVNNRQPLLAVHNANEKWISYSPELADDITGLYNSSTCSGNADDSLCIAVGKTQSSTDSPDKAAVSETLVSLSQDGGRTWNELEIDGLPVKGTFLGVACADDNGNGSAAKCRAVGRTLGESGSRYIKLITDNGGDDWDLTDGVSPPNANESFFYNTSVEDSIEIYLSLSKLMNSTTFTPIIDIIIPNGKVYNNPIAYDEFNLLQLFDTSCSSDWCIAVGAVQKDEDSVSGPAIFSIKASEPETSNDFTPDVEITTVLFGAACTTVTDLDQKIVCIAVGGSSSSSNSAQVIYVNKDLTAEPINGWVLADLPELANGTLSSAACATTTDGKKAVCTAAGYQLVDANTTEKLILENIDVGGIGTWTQAEGSFPKENITNNYGSACTTTTENTVVCTAAGLGVSEDDKPLYANIDMENDSWSPVTTTPTLPEVGACFTNAGASGSSTGSYLIPFQNPNLPESLCELYEVTPDPISDFFGLNKIGLLGNK